MPDTPTAVEPTRAPRNRAERRHPDTIPTAVTATVPKLVLTIEEACTALTISRPTLYELIAAGRLRTVMAGRRRLIPLTELERLLAEDS